jgi:hypothetical protein
LTTVLPGLKGALFCVQQFGIAIRVGFGCERPERLTGILVRLQGILISITATRGRSATYCYVLTPVKTINRRDVVDAIFTKLCRCVQRVLFAIEGSRWKWFVVFVLEHHDVGPWPFMLRLEDDLARFVDVYVCL